MKYCFNCGLWIKLETLVCNFCDTQIEDSIQNTDSLQHMGQQPIGQSQPTEQLQPTEQSQPMEQSQPTEQLQATGQQQYMKQQSVEQLQPIEQQQYMVQQQPIDQLQPVDQQRPTNQQLPIDQQLPFDYQQYMDQQLLQKQQQQQLKEQQQSMEEHQQVGQQQLPYHQPRQSYSLNPSYQQPSYQQSQHSRDQQSSGRHAAYDGYSRQPQQGYADPEYLTMGGFLLFFVVVAILGVIVSIVNTYPFIIMGIFLINLASMAREILPDGVTAAMYVNLFAQIIALGTYVLFVIAIVQIFMRKSTFLLLIQLSWLILVFAFFLEYVASNMFIAELNLALAEYGLMMFQFHPIAGFAEVTGITTASLIGRVVFAVGATLLFTLYFSKSARVRTYMRGEKFKRKALFAYDRPPV
jgi:hypothetical protein